MAAIWTAGICVPCMSKVWRVALIDSGADRPPGLPPAAACRFVDSGAGVDSAPPAPDAIGHGTRVAAIIGSASASVELLLAQVFSEGRTTTAAVVAAAVRWASEAHVGLIHMSLGLREDRSVLAVAVAEAQHRGCLIVASAPARGRLPYPAAYDGVIRASGDARCAVGEISALDPAQARFGACPRLEDVRHAGGASVAAAHLTRFIVTHLQPRATFAVACAQLQSRAAFRGPERRAGACDPQKIDHTQAGAKEHS